jgi:hypothetical protein
VHDPQQQNNTQTSSDRPGRTRSIDADGASQNATFEIPFGVVLALLLDFIIIVKVVPTEIQLEVSTVLVQVCQGTTVTERQ